MISKKENGNTVIYEDTASLKLKLNELQNTVQQLQESVSQLLKQNEYHEKVLSCVLELSRSCSCQRKNNSSSIDMMLI